MDQRVLQVADQLLLIERELRALKLWSDTAPTAEQLDSGVPFGVGVIEFDQWLQWVFVDKLKALIEADLPLPKVSGIAPMAEECYKHDLGRFAVLIKLLAETDQHLTQD